MSAGEVLLCVDSPKEHNTHPSELRLEQQGCGHSTSRGLFLRLRSEQAGRKSESYSSTESNETPGSKTYCGGSNNSQTGVQIRQCGPKS